MQVEADKDKANDDGAGSVQSEENSSNRDERSADGMSASQRNSNQSSSPDDFSGRGAAKSLGISEREQHIVNCSRLVFIVCLLVSAAVLGTVVFFFTSEDEKGDFEALFYDLAGEIVDLSDAKISRVIHILEGLSVLTTSYVLAEREARPGNGKGFVTIPALEEQLRIARQNSGALVIAYSPQVLPSEADAWNEYSTEKQGWIQESYLTVNVTDSILPDIWSYPVGEEETNKCGVLEHLDAPAYNDDFHSSEGIAERVPLEANSGPFSPVWTFSPPPHADDVFVLNFDLRTKTAMRKAVEYIAATRLPTFLEGCNQAAWFDHHEYGGVLQAAIVFPVFDGYDRATAGVIGHLIAIIPWVTFFNDILLHDAPPVYAVVSNTCEKVFTLLMKGDNTELVAEADVHDKAYDWEWVTGQYTSLVDYEMDDLDADINRRRAQELANTTCQYSLKIYPTKTFVDLYVTSNPAWYTCVVLGVFLLASLLFLLFDCFVRRRTARVLTVALRQNAIVSSLFPKNVRAKMMAEADQNEKLGRLGKAGIKSFLNADKGSNDPTQRPLVASKPIADIFPATTIMFADIAGFTAWSSAREPSQVFTLLESIYAEFDRIAQRRKVFKVEVVGDCYVAVSGLPDPCKDHAVVMAKFATECLRDMNRVTRYLVLELGPDTIDLKLRVGLHSGPVVAGVLRGDKSRFQLFGDTMNTASRMESTGVADMIQVSQETADLLVAAGKKGWLTQRKDPVSAKGKGELITFLLSRTDLTKDLKSMVSDGSRRDLALQDCDGSDKAAAFDRSSEWTVEVMAGLLREIVASRAGSADVPTGKSRARLAALEREVTRRSQEGGTTVIDEVQEIIEIHDSHSHGSKHNKILPNDVKLKSKVLHELRDYVREVALMHNDNPFHNFEHANHVTMGVVKLLSRIVAPDIDEIGNKTLEDHTYGITADPLTRFAVVFSALIHDVDHPGVSNMQLVKECAKLSTLYHNQSVAEQNSVDIAWHLLMDSKYENLRYTIYTTEAEFRRFRSLIVNAVMATDIMDKDLKKLRNDRWDVAFDVQKDQVSREAANRKATIVIEHLIQASDIAHTMQHWHVYRKWNERLFQEMYKAYETGRLESDPSATWYEGEMGFFDFYIIPLAKKLKDCGVFGVSSDEYLSYAIQNRKEWEQRGKTLVEEMANAVKSKQ